jgi:hypothetical protein
VITILCKGTLWLEGFKLIVPLLFTVTLSGEVIMVSVVFFLNNIIPSLGKS